MRGRPPGLLWESDFIRIADPAGDSWPPKNEFYANFGDWDCLKSAEIASERVDRSVEGRAPPSEQAIGGHPYAPTSSEPKWDSLPGVRGREFSSAPIRRTVFGSALDPGRAIRPHGMGHPHRSRPRIRYPVLTRRHGIQHFRRPLLGTISQGPGGDCVHAFDVPGPPKPPVPPRLSSLPLLSGCIRFANTEMHLSAKSGIYLTQVLQPEAEKIFGNFLRFSGAAAVSVIRFIFGRLFAIWRESHKPLLAGRKASRRPIWPARGELSARADVGDATANRRSGRSCSRPTRPSGRNNCQLHEMPGETIPGAYSEETGTGNPALNGPRPWSSSASICVICGQIRRSFRRGASASIRRRGVRRDGEDRPQMTQMDADRKSGSPTRMGAR